MAGKIIPLEARKRFKRRMFFTLALRKKPLQIDCRCCGKLIPSNMEWKCTSCNGENRKTRVYSFLFKCKVCKDTPASVRCPHCKAVVFLDKRRDARCPAEYLPPPKTVQPPPPVESREEQIARLSRERADEEERLKHEIHVSRLKQTRDALKKAADEANKSTLDKLKEKRQARRVRTMAIHQIAKQEKLQDDSQFAHDDELRQMAEEDRKAWVEEESQREPE